MQSHKVLLEEKIESAAKLAVLRQTITARAEQDAAKLADIERLKAEYDAIEPLDFLIVSGLPRSGTSLVMQILQVGGLPLMTDAKQAPTQNHLHGPTRCADRGFPVGHARAPRQVAQSEKTPHRSPREPQPANPGSAQKSDRVELREVSFPDLTANPEPTFNELAAFLGQQFCPGPKVEACIKPALHRNRKSSPA